MIRAAHKAAFFIKNVIKIKFIIMINSENKIERAIEIALQSHSGQTDKAGAPYILHCLRVMIKGKNENEQIVGVLHDTIEDTEITAEYLSDNGFQQEIVSAVQCLTKIKNETEEDYIRKVQSNELAKKVKLNDLEDNMNILRLNKITEKDIMRLNKYIKMYKILSEK